MGCSLPQAENLPIYCTGLGSKHALQGSGALINGRQGQASRLLWVEGLLFFFFFLKSILLHNKLRSRGCKRLQRHNMVDDLMVPANCGNKGVIEWRPRSISHKVSVRSTSKHLRKA